MINNFKDEDFEDKIKNEEVSILQFSTSWCKPCQNLRPIMEKLSEEYGLKVARAIKNEWFSRSTARFSDNISKFSSNLNNYHQLRLYARGEQPIDKYKNELSINGDLSYLNLDWKPVPIVSKFVDIVVNGMSQRNYEINCFSQDANGVNKRTEYMESILRDMKAKEYNELAKANFIRLLT